MRIVVIGANGNTGREVVTQARDQGHDVVAAMRRPETMAGVAGIEIATIDLSHYASLVAAFAGADAVVSALGHGGLKDAVKPTTLYSDGVRAIRDAMWTSEVRRLVALSSGGVVQDDNAPWFYTALLRRYLVNTHLDMARMETVLEEDGSLDWTAVRLTYLLKGASKPILVEEGKIGRGNFKIHSQDAAAFILECVTQGKWIGGHPVIGYAK